MIKIQGKNITINYLNLLNSDFLNYQDFLKNRKRLKKLKKLKQ